MKYKLEWILLAIVLFIFFVGAMIAFGLLVSSQPFLMYPRYNYDGVITTIT